MKKFIFNGETFVKDELFGIARHTYELLLALDKYVKPGDITVLVPGCKFDSSMFNNIEFISMGSFNAPNSAVNKLTRRIWRYMLFPCYCFFSRAITVNTFLPWAYYNFNIMSIYDCTPELFPEYFKISPEKERWYAKLQKNQKRNVKKTKLVLTDSQSAKNDISKVYGVSLEKIQFIYCGWQHFSRFAEDDSVLDRFGLSDKNFFFSLGSRMPHKNIKWVSYAAKKHPRYKFVVTGSQHGYKDMSFEGEIPDNMIFTGYLKDEEIKSLMRHCKAFIQPSFYEGFGLPPLEAMSVGADCIVSNKGSLPEVYKNSVWYIDPYDYENIDLDEIMSRPKESNDVILNEYSWEKSARKLWDTLQKLANE